MRRRGSRVLAAFLALGLLNVFGQRPGDLDGGDRGGHGSRCTRRSAFAAGSSTRRASGSTPSARCSEATLVLDSGWAEGITINTVEPSPIGEASRDGRLAFELGRIPAGQKHVFFLQLQVNPTNVGHRSQDVELYDGDELLATIDRTITVWP